MANVGQTFNDSSSNIISPFLNFLTDLCLCSDEDKESGAGRRGTKKRGGAGNRSGAKRSNKNDSESEDNSDK